jgi:hypothetical protein
LQTACGFGFVWSGRGYLRLVGDKLIGGDIQLVLGERCLALVDAVRPRLELDPG